MKKSSRPPRRRGPSDADADAPRGPGHIASSPHEHLEGATDVPRDHVHLYPGHVFASASPCAITTILGSCVSIFLWDPATRAGGLNHYLLPHWANASAEAGRYGNVALDRLLEELVAEGAVVRRLQAKIFGGASLLGGVELADPLGAQNVAVARSLLAAARIPILAEDIEGRRGRKLIVHTDTGDAWVKLL